MSCCPHPVERHAYNGCAECGCAVTWPEHPDRDKDTSPEAVYTRARLAALKASELEAARLGTPNQLERYKAGFLPEDELTQLARGQLFQLFEEFPRWSQSRDRERMEREFRHRGPEGVAPNAINGELQHETTAAGDMTSVEWETFKKITRAASRTAQHPWLERDAVNVEALAHYLTCKGCDKALVRLSVKVTIHWAGRELVREYAITPT